MVASDFLHPPAHKTLRDWVFDCLRSSIISGELAPGQRIVEADLAKQLDVSKSPVREAILQLKQDGLVIDAAKGRGVIVAPLRPVDVDEIYAVRIALEALAARLAATRGSADARQRLHSILDQMRTASAAGDVRQLFNLDVEFHAGLCAAAGNGRLMNLFESIRPDLQRIFFFAVTAPPSNGGHEPDQTLADHESLLAAIDQGNGDEAEALLRRHIEDRSIHILAALGSSAAADD